MQTMTTPPPTTDPAPADRDWFGGRRWTGIAAIAVILILGIAILVLVLNHHSGTKHDTTPTTPPVGTSNPPTTSVPSSSPPSVLPTTVPTVAPQGTSWTIYDTVALPSLPGAGPSHIDGAIATGYAQTPLGALLCAGNNLRYGLANDAQWRAAADAMLAPGSGKDAWLRLRPTQPWTPAKPGDLTQIAAFQFLSYTTTDAVIQLVTRDVHGLFQVGPVHLRWSGTDWRVDLPASGVGTSQVMLSLTGFIPWGAV